MKKSERTKLHITMKAARLFNKKGYAGTSMDDILKDAGLSKGALYGHFKSKEEVAIASFHYNVNLIIEALRSRTKVIDKSLDKLKAVVYFYKEHLLQEPFEFGCPILNASTEVADQYPAIREHVKYSIDRWRSSVARLVEKGKRRKEIKPKVNADTFAMKFIGMMEGGLLLTQIYKDRKYFDAMASELITLVESLAIAEENL